jgi:hypothetical protein
MMQHGRGHVLQPENRCEVLAHGHVDPEDLSALNIEITIHRVRLAERGGGATHFAHSFSKMENL